MGLAASNNLTFKCRLNPASFICRYILVQNVWLSLQIGSKLEVWMLQHHLIFLSQTQACSFHCYQIQWIDSFLHFTCVHLGGCLLDHKTFGLYDGKYVLKYIGLCTSQKLPKFMKDACSIRFSCRFKETNEKRD